MIWKTAEQGTGAPRSIFALVYSGSTHLQAERTPQKNQQLFELGFRGRVEAQGESESTSTIPFMRYNFQGKDQMTFMRSVNWSKTDPTTNSNANPDLIGGTTEAISRDLPQTVETL
jgi:hypothetical protein